MYLNLTDSSVFSTSSIGVLLTNNAYIPPSPTDTGIAGDPQLMNPADNFISDTLNWMVYNETFIASSNYQFITIGNFKNFSDTPLMNTGLESNPWNNNPDWPNVLIDDVSLEPVEATFDTICVGENVSFLSQGDSLFSWANSYSPDLIISTDSILNASPITNTTYYEDSNLGRINHVVIVTQNQNLNFGADTNLCPGDTLMLTATNPYSTYLWQDGATESEYNLSEEGTYWVEVTNSCGIFTDTLDVTYNEILFDLGSDTSLCAGENLVLDPNLSEVSYLWQNGSTNSVYSVPSWLIPGQFFLEVHDSIGCGRDTIYVDYHSEIENTFFAGIGAICEGQSKTLSYTSEVGQNYFWSDGSTDTSIVINEPGEYWLEVSNRCLSNSDTIRILSKPTPFFDLGEDIVRCDGESIVLQINTIEDALVWWVTPSTSSPITIRNEGEFIAMAELNGCRFTDSLYVSFEDCEISLTIPNVFTPNADGLNDLFYIEGINISAINIQIFNRWGQLIFETNDINKSWNGKSPNGIDCPPGAYFYTITARNSLREKVFSGTITLLK